VQWNENSLRHARLVTFEPTTFEEPTAGANVSSDNSVPINPDGRGSGSTRWSAQILGNKSGQQGSPCPTGTLFAYRTLTLRIRYPSR